MDNFGLAQLKAEGSKAEYDDKAGPQDPYKPPEFEVLGPLTDFERKFPPVQDTKYMCHCGSDQFTAYDYPGGYQTSLRCVRCDENYSVHEG
jgi:hypothetical protein